MRREGGANVAAAGTARLVVESVAFPLEGDAARAVEELERTARDFPGDAVVLRFGRLWGPAPRTRRRPSGRRSTWSAPEPRPPA